MTCWPNAQSYCRKHHTDLVSGLNQLQELTSKIAHWPNASYWIGLFHDTWRWSDESSSSFRHWDHDSAHYQPNNHRCAMTMLREEGRWKCDSCDAHKPFICYDGEFSLVCSIRITLETVWRSGWIYWFICVFIYLGMSVCMLYFFQWWVHLFKRQWILHLHSVSSFTSQQHVQKLHRLNLFIFFFLTITLKLCSWYFCLHQRVFCCLL